MATTREELENFHEYAATRLRETSTELSLDELLMEWADRRDRSEINAAISRGLADIDAGRFEPADQAMARIREEFGLPPE
jgi:predicted transcriptional regulator